MPNIEFREITFPDPRFADSEGLVAVGGDLRPDMLITAYTHGIFPWTSEPVSWWSPDPRAVFIPSEFKLSSRMERAYRNTKMQFTFDKDFRGVITGCSTVSRHDCDESWIDGNFIEAYCELHRLNIAHSCEAWLDGKLVGGVYGVALRNLFAGESMFHTATNASTFALKYLMTFLAENGFTLFDSQVINDHTRHLGAKEIAREQYLLLLKEALK